jgi:nucleotide-binding universal stress UspA family protein
MYKTIVVGTDGSERSSLAVDHAIAIAKMNGATLQIVHARKLVPDVGSRTDFARATIAESNQAFDEGDEVCARALSQATKEGVSGEMHTVEGDAASAIANVAERTGADLIVVGNQGTNGVKRLFLGSVPNKVSHHCPCSLLIVDTRPQRYAK